MIGETYYLFSGCLNFVNRLEEEMGLLYGGEYEFAHQLAVI
jgi:hypothetical protein